MTRTIGVVVGVAILVVRTALAACEDPLAIPAARAAIDAACPCDAPGQTHADYVHCARAHLLVGISRDCASAVKRCYSRSTCGKPGAVTCCRTKADGTTRCSVRRDATRCSASAGGTACVGVYSSCCDACGAGGCATTTSTTTTSSTTSTTLFPDVPCTGGSGYPTCDGTCDAGFECRGFADSAGNACACFPVGSTPCDPTGFPQCGDLACPGSKRCGGFQFFDPATGFTNTCACVDPTHACTAGPGGMCVSVGYCQPPFVCGYTPILPHVTCPCCGCGPPQ